MAGFLFFTHESTFVYEMDELIELLKTESGAAAAVGAFANAVAASLAVVVSAISVWISMTATAAQRKHNRLSVRPLAEITVANYENCLRVKLRNHGVGPLIVESFTVSNGTASKGSILDWMPDLPKEIYWANFVSIIDGRSIAPNKEIVLIELIGDDEDSVFVTARNAVRSSLEPLSLTLLYTDIYGERMPLYARTLSWFGCGSTA